MQLHTNCRYGAATNVATYRLQVCSCHKCSYMPWHASHHFSRGSLRRLLQQVSRCRQCPVLQKAVPAAESAGMY
eukprot:3795490-Pleurochrysis_carterae.AAC.4